MPGPDFEDNLQIACAITDFMQAIVTRDPETSPHPLFVFIHLWRLLAALHR